MSDTPRRVDINRYVPAETAIREAILRVEEMPADMRLTDAVVLLGRAKDRVADFVDGNIVEAARTEDELRVRGVGRDLFEPRMLCIALSERPTDDEIIIIHNILRHHFP